MDSTTSRVRFFTLPELVEIRWQKGFGGIRKLEAFLASKDAPFFVVRTSINCPKLVIQASPIANNTSPFVRVRKIPSGQGLKPSCVRF